VIHALTFAVYAVTLNGEPVLPRARAAVVGGHVLLPVRALGNAVGADVGYDNRTRTITVQRGSHVARLTIQGAGTGVNVHGTTYAPLRSVASAFGLDVGYDAVTRTVALADRGPAPVARVPLPTATPAPVVRGTTIGIVVTPASGADVHDPYPAISARFSGVASIDPASVRVIVDGRDVSVEAAVIGDQVLLTPRRALAPGTHTVSVTARDIAGTPLESQWSFVDNFTFAVAPAPTPYPIQAIWIDRWIVPGTNAFDVYVQGAPGITGYVGVDGVGTYFPLFVYTATSYVAHVAVPNGVNQPFARVAARLTLPNGAVETIVLPQTINLVTAPIKPFPPGTTSSYPTPAPTPRPRRRVDVPTPTPTPSATSMPRRPLSKTPPPSAMPSPTPTPVPVATSTPSPRPSRRPVPRRTLAPTPPPS
jgi:hypothetical protein